MVGVGARVIGVDATSEPAEAFFRRAVPLTREGKIHTRNRLSKEMIVILCPRTSWTNLFGLRVDLEGSFNMFLLMRVLFI